MVIHRQKGDGKPDPGFWFVLGLILFFGSLIWAGNNHMKYQQQLSQVDWPMTQATVFQVDIHQERSGRHHLEDCYDVQYHYEVDGQTYTGAAWHQRDEVRVGDVFPVKYNPEHPNQSNHILEPSRGLLIASLLFCGVGAVILVTSLVRMIYLRRIQRKNQA
ncbi:DUF3592 domain-containing protein [Pseudoflavonifractor sp. An85]|uniref:DUF3592 domain-containing protein n=1 Tax=Pseudoflavonifractor sp. An85 TaxID=1965661 RepID=UPI001302BAF6|nr:DUF3592 domain-containing protein [Pseudoflavonifractor sp. An85]